MQWTEVTEPHLYFPFEILLVMNWEIGIDIYTLICIKWITNKNLLYKEINKIKFKNSKKRNLALDTENLRLSQISKTSNISEYDPCGRCLLC